MMSPLHIPHARIGMRVGTIVANFVEQHKLGLVTGADGGYLIERNPDTLRAPDVGFVAAARIPPEGVTGFFPGAPDLAVEVNSPSDRASEVLSKIHLWLATGSRMVWLVDPPSQTATVYRDSKHITVYGVGDVLDGQEVLPGFRVPVADLFAS